MQDTASYLGLEQELQHIPVLRGLLISVMPDCLLFDSYMPETQAWNKEDMASELGELFERSQHLMELFRSTGQSQITVENDDAVLVVRKLADSFIVGMIFRPDTPLALIRVYAGQISEKVTERLQSVEVSDVQESFSSAVRILEYLKQYAPDPHTSLMRIALKTGIPLGTLNQPQQLNNEQTELLERAVCDILGLDELVF